mmetsp:Transcript_1898/g.6198  ORF Transcript_1898/g.6198 Transcript_1898/m.6198 type:complete len:247 (-) Transcript_1898:8-748(-)
MVQRSPPISTNIRLDGNQLLSPLFALGHPPRRRGAHHLRHQPRSFPVLLLPLLRLLLLLPRRLARRLARLQRLPLPVPHVFQHRLLLHLPLPTRGYFLTRPGPDGRRLLPRRLPRPPRDPTLTHVVVLRGLALFQRGRRVDLDVICVHRRRLQLDLFCVGFQLSLRPQVSLLCDTDLVPARTVWHGSEVVQRRGHPCAGHPILGRLFDWHAGTACGGRAVEVSSSRASELLSQECSRDSDLEDAQE